MRFKKTYRFSPITELGDLPWEYDLYHHRVDSLPETKKQLDDYVARNNIMPDVSWWEKQKDYCLNGYTVPFSIEKGGDVFIDGEDAIWNDSAKILNYAPGIDIPPESVYMPEYDLVIKNEALKISGRHYMYLNFWIIFGLKKGEDVKKNVSPRFLDVDFGLFHRVEYMMSKKNGNLQETKTRQKGYSEKMALLLGHNMVFLPGSLNIIAGGMSDDADKTFNNTVRGLDNLRNTQFYRQRSINKIHDHFLKNKYDGAELHSITCKDNAQAISRHSPSLIIYEEGGKWKKGLLKQAKEFVKPSLRAEGRQTGFEITLGTGGDMDLGAADLEQMHYNPKDNDIIPFRNKWERVDTGSYSAHFTPGWHYLIIDDDGNSLKKESIKALEEEESKRKKPEDLYIFQTQNAIYAADAFRISGGIFFGATIANWANERKAYIITHKEEQRVRRYDIRWKHGLSRWYDGVIMSENPEGMFMISEMPRTYRDAMGNEAVYRNAYKAATDSYDQDKAKTSTSKGSCWIKKGFISANESYNKIVAGLVVRPEIYEGGREAFYEATALLCVAYGCAPNLIEHKNLLIFDWYYKNKMNQLLKERPDVIIARYVKDSKSSNFYGIDGSFKPNALKILKDSLSEKVNVFSIDFPEVLEAIVKYKYHHDYNCDIVVSLAYLETLMEDEKNILVTNEDKKVMKPISYKRMGDRIVKV